MPYNTQQFQILTPQQANPFGTGFMQGLQGASEIQKMLQSKQEFPLTLQQMQIANAIQEFNRQKSQAESKYYPQMALAELQKAQAEPNEINARTGLYGAQTNELNSMTPARLKELQLKNQFYPQMTQAELKERGARTNLYGAQTNELNTLTPEKLKELQLKNQFYPQQIQAEIANNKALADWRKSGGFGNSRLGGVSGQTLNILQRQVQTENPNFSAEQLNDATNAYIEGRDTLNDGTKLRPPSGIVATQLDNITKQRYTTSQLNQNRYASTLDTLLDASSQLMPSVSKYSSAIGSAKGSLDQMAGALGGEGSPEYQDYIHFTRDIVPSMAGEFIRVLGAHATDKQKDMMLKMADPTSWDISPKTALNNFNYLSDLYKNKITPSIKKTTHQYMINNKTISDNIKKGSESNPINLVIRNGKVIEE